MTDTWTGTNGGDWNTAGNWSENVAPGSKDDYGDDVVIDTGAPQHIYLYDTNNSDYGYFINALTVGANDEVSLVSGRMIVNDTTTITGRLDIEQGFEVDFESQDDVQTVRNTGTIFLAGSLHPGAGQEVDLTGGGEVELFDGSILGVSLTGFETDNDIYGSGTIEIYNLQNDAGGIIEARGTLTLLVSNAIANYGELGATGNFSTLDLESSVQNDDGGSIIADASDAEVTIDSVVITGGSVEAVDGGVIVGTGGATLDGVTATGTFEAASSKGLALAHDTTISQDVIFEGTLGASVFLEGGRIVTDGNDAHFTNSTTLLGTGGIGDGMLIIDNAGTIEACGGNLTLALSASDEGANYNQVGGRIIALKNSTADIGAGDPDGSTFENDGALIAYTGGQIVVGQGVEMTNFSGSELQNGFYEAAGNGATLELNQYFSSLGTTIVLSGAGSVIESNDESSGQTETLESMLTTIDKYATLAVIGGRNYVTTVSSFTVNGNLEMSGGTFQLGGGTSGRFIIKSGGLVSLEGKAGIALATGSKGFASIYKGGSLEKLVGGSASMVKVSLTNNGTITAGSGSLDFAGAVDGTGRDYIEKGATLEFASAVGKTQAVAFSTGGGELLLADAKHFTGTIAKVGAGDTLDIDGLGSGTTFTFLENAGKTQGVLTLKHGSTIDRLTLVGNYASSGFKLATGKSGDTMVTYVPPQAPAVASGEDLSRSLFEAAFAPSSFASAPASIDDTAVPHALAAASLAAHVHA